MPAIVNDRTASGSKDQLKIDFIVREFTRYEAACSDRFKLCKQIYERWQGKPISRAFTWQNRVNVPIMFEGEQTITPRLFTALFPTDAPVDVKVEGDTPEDQGNLIKEAIQHYFRVANLQGESYPALTQCTLFGTGYVEAGGWTVKRGWTVDETTGERMYELIESRPDAKYVDFFEIFPHPLKKKVGDLLPLIRRRYVDAESLKALTNSPGFDTSRLKEALNTKSPRGTIENEYEVLEWWGPWDDTYTDAAGKVVERMAVPYWSIIINRAVMIRDIPNPFNHQSAPICKVKLYPNLESQWFGVGIGQVGLPEQERVNKIVNQRLDNVELLLNKEKVVNANDPLINRDKLKVSKPSQFHLVSDMANIQYINTPDVTVSSYKEEEISKQNFREATGATAHLMPEAGTEHRTALGIQLLQGAAGMRFRPILRMLEEDLVAAAAMFFFSNLKQFMSREEWIQITGKDGLKEAFLLTPKDLQAKVYFVPTGVSETLNKETQIGQLLRFKELTMNDPTVNRQEINKRIAELMGFKQIDKMMTPVQAPQATGGLDSETQLRIQQRIAEGATPEQIKEEMLGRMPMGEGEEGGGEVSPEEAMAAAAEAGAG